MAAYFLDTSALVKRNVQEAGTAWVRNLTRAILPHDLPRKVSGEVVPSLGVETRPENGAQIVAA